MSVRESVRQVLRPTIVRGIPWVLFGAVLLPALATTAVGIVILALGSLPLSGSIAVGVLTVCFATFVLAGAIVTLFLILHQNHLARMQTEFIANASHELRTPLTSIRMYVETLRMGRVSSQEDTDACLAALEQETNRLSILVEQLLDFRAASDKGSAALDREVVAPGLLLRETTAPFLARPEQGDRVLVITPKGLPGVRIDRRGFTEAVSNLIQNALTHGGVQGPVVVSACAQDAGVAIEVRDSGPGVPPEDQRRVFDRFYRAASTTDSKIPGFGLGLSIVKGFAETHGGRASVKNAPDGGAIFALWLPACEESPPPDTLEGARAGGAGGPP